MTQQATQERPIPDFLQRYLPLKGEAAKRKIAGDGTLFVEKVPTKFPCFAAASRLLHAAQDGGFATICIMKGLRHRHYFKVYDLVRHHRKWVGPAMKSFTSREDCWLDERKKIWQVGWQPKPDAKVLPATTP